VELLILNYEYPPLGGGAGAMTQTLAEGLAGHDHIVTVVTTWFKGEDEVSEKGNLKIIRLKSKRKFTYRSNPQEMVSWIFKSKSFLKTYCLSHHFDHCLANFSIPGGETALFLKRKFNIPYIIISHGHDIPWFFKKQMFWYHLFTYFRVRKICRNSEKLVLLTELMKKNADKFMGEKHKEKNCIIPNGYDNSLFYPDYTKRNKVFTVVFCGRLVEQKDPMTFLKALQILFLNKIDFKAEIYGDGVLRKQMEEFVRNNNLMTKVNFKGWVNKEELANAYRKAHVFVSTSHEEGMSIAILEAIASGLYTFATPVSNNVSIITNLQSGEIFNCGDIQSLAQKLQDYYENKFLKNFQILEKVLEEFGGVYRNMVMVDGYYGLAKSLNQINDNTFQE
jgi:glycosyltransferase involved in cell wall biosynthesis